MAEANAISRGGRLVAVPGRLLPDARLMQLAARGEAGAFAVIYERHHQALYRYCRSILGNEADARDALQNAMVRALRALPGEERQIAAKPWLFRIAHNEAIRLLQARRPDAAIDEASDLQSSGPEHEHAARERLRELVSDLHQLPDAQRGALLMREVNDLTYGDIGAALNISEPAAKQAVYEARRSLQDFARGREMDCETVTRSISMGDGRLLRARKVRAHLRGCADCRDFKSLLASRKTALNALAPTLSAPAAAAVLSAVLGGGNATGSGAGLLGLLSGGGKAAGTAAATKGIVTAAVAVGLGMGTVGVAANHRSEEPPTPTRSAHQDATGGGDSPATRERTDDRGDLRARAGAAGRDEGRAASRRRERAASDGPGQRRDASGPRDRAASGERRPAVSPPPLRIAPRRDPAGVPDVGRYRQPPEGRRPSVSPPGGARDGYAGDDSAPPADPRAPGPAPTTGSAPGAPAPSGPPASGRQR